MDDSREYPYLSIPIASRNDDHGGDMLNRMQASLTGLLESLENHRIESELILVDWNPPPGKPLLKDTIKWPDKLNYCTIRNIVVPANIHQRFKYSGKMPMRAVVAINTGIRRTRGKFILPGVIDLFYSEELMVFIASRALEKDKRYRVDRIIVDKKVIACKTLKEQLAFCRNNVISVNEHLHTGLANGLPDLHTNACGDFQLMSRENWFLLRGYRERDAYGAHCDGLLSMASYAAGVKEVILNNPLNVYHIDHEEKYTDRIQETKPLPEKLLSIPFLPAILRRKLLTLYRMSGLYKTKNTIHGIPTLDLKSFVKMSKDIISGRRSYILNDDDWGLGDDSLKEDIINKAEWDKAYG